MRKKRPAPVVMFESVPLGWEIDEKKGVLRATADIVDPLPHVAVRVFESGSVVVVCEQGLQHSRRVIDAIGVVIPKHLGGGHMAAETVVAARRALEVELAKLAGSTRIRSWMKASRNRSWR